MSSLLALSQTEGVRRTLARYNVAGDRGRLEELAGTFLEEGTLESLAWQARGRLAIVARLEELMAACKPQLTLVRHHLTTCLIDIVSADVATSRTYVLVITDIGPDHSGSYTDTLRRRGDEWLFESRKLRVDWVSPHSLFALDALRPRRGA